MSKSDHALVIADLSPFDNTSNGEVRGFIHQEGKKTAFIDQRQFFHNNNALSFLFPINTLSALHEMGHQFWLADLKAGNQLPGNLMNSGSMKRGNNLNHGQKFNVIFNAERELLNKGTNQRYLPIIRR